MDKSAAFEQAKRVYPLLKPTRVSGFALGEDGTAAILTGHEEEVAMVIYNRGDLWRLKGIVDAALERGAK